MQIDVKGRNLTVSDDLKERVEKRFEKVSKQVSELPRLEVEVFEERNPAIAEDKVAEAALFLRGVTRRARESSRELTHAVTRGAEDLGRQTKRNGDKRRKRRESRAGALQESAPP